MRDHEKIQNQRWAVMKARVKRKKGDEEAWVDVRRDLTGSGVRG